MNMTSIIKRFFPELIEPPGQSYWKTMTTTITEPTPKDDQWQLTFNSEQEKRVANLEKVFEEFSDLVFGTKEIATIQKIETREELISALSLILHKFPLGLTYREIRKHLNLAPTKRNNGLVRSALRRIGTNHTIIGKTEIRYSLKEPYLFSPWEL